MPPDPTTPSAVRITGTGRYLPERILTNAELEKMVDTNDEWITSRTGIKERRVAADDESTSDLAAKAALKALESAGLAVDEVELIVVATVTPDMFFPSTACFAQQKIGATNAVAFDISAACSGFLFALQIARNLVEHGAYRNALVIGAEKLSSLVNWKDRNTCVLFGDGAGAAVLQREGDLPRPKGGRVLSEVLRSDAEQTGILLVPGGGSACPITAENADERLNSVKMEGREVYKHAVTRMKECALEVLEAADVTIEEVALVIAHQANRRIIDAITDRLGVPEERCFLNVQHYGNTSAASVAIALDEALEQGRIKPGDKILFVAFGAGLTWAGSLMEWA